MVCVNQTQTAINYVVVYILSDSDDRISKTFQNKIRLEKSSFSQWKLLWLKIYWKCLTQGLTRLKVN